MVTLSKPFKTRGKPERGSDLKPWASRWPKEQVTVHLLNGLAGTVSYVHKIPNGDGAFQDNFELLYSRTYENPLVRGGLKVSYCNPDNSEVSAANGNIRISSTCALQSPASGNLMFDFNLRPKDGSGSISIYIPETTGDDIQRNIQFSGCK